MLREEALNALSGCELIVHAGDIGDLDIITRLEGIATTVAVRGNIDKESWADKFNEVEAFEFGGKYFYLIHNIDELDLDPAGEFDAVIFGHSHKPHTEVRDNVLYFNPASAGPRRFKLPVCVGYIEIDSNEIVGSILELEID